jgi:hypothetical protein
LIRRLLNNNPGKEKGREKLMALKKGVAPP